MNMFRRDLGSTAPNSSGSTKTKPGGSGQPHHAQPERTGRGDNRSLAGQGSNLHENSSEINPKPKRAGVMGVMQKVNPFKSTSQASSTSSTSSSSSSVSKAPSSETLEQETDLTRNPGVLKGVMQKVNPFKSTSQVTKAPSSESLEQGRVSDSSQSPGMLRGVMQKVNPFKPSTQAPKGDPPNDAGDPAETEKEVQGKQNPGMIAGMMQKVNPFKSSQPKDTQSLHSDLSSSSGSLADNNNFPEKQNPGKIVGMMQKVNPFKSSQPKDTQSLHSDLSSSSGSLTDNNNLPEKQNPGVFKGMMQKVNPFRSYTQMPDEECQTDSAVPKTSSSFKTQDKKAIDGENSSSSESLDDSTIERHTIWYSDADTSCEVKNQPTAAPKRRTMTFRIKRILPTALFGSGTKDSATASSDTPQETVEVQTLELAEGTVLDPLDDEDGLLAWWGTVEGWDEWNDGNQDEEAEDVVEEAADRVFMAARLFVRFFNQRGGSLQQRILELLSLADAADTFHKKTVTASVGGGVASVAGSITYHHGPHSGALHGGNVAHCHGRGHRHSYGGRRGIGFGQHHGHGPFEDGPQEGGEDDPRLRGGDKGHQGVPGVSAGRDGDT
ncbi:hypothetical protein E3U43_007985 [Larimichthys crocea]|uniref:Uncharacterized protein n=1 Tax=Larimichthys crocea TaxID=215358 RepID=A0ACD3Q5J7_LARCR|nr:hypothetical protein E3U43_007985 [Larimichthys crocea]